MHGSLIAEDGPVVLIVEDEAEQRVDRANQLLDRGCVPVAVESADAAARELTASPGIDLVLTDIHLVPKKRGDKSGVALARFVKADHPRIPIVGYSAYFSPGDLSEEELSLFDYQYVKGQSSIDEIEVSLDACVRLASQARKQRLSEGKSRLTGQAAISPEFVLEVLRSANPGQEDDVEKSLHEAGFQLKLVKFLSTATGDPLIVWVRDKDRYVDVEVYGQSDLYVTAETETEALEHLIDLMHLYWRELSEAEDPLGGPAQRLYDFLARMQLDRPESD